MMSLHPSDNFHKFSGKKLRHDPGSSYRFCAIGRLEFDHGKTIFRIHEDQVFDSAADLVKPGAKSVSHIFLTKSNQSVFISKQFFKFVAFETLALDKYTGDFFKFADIVGNEFSHFLFFGVNYFLYGFVDQRGGLFAVVL